jgi:hypothetical protein
MNPFGQFGRTLLDGGLVHCKSSSCTAQRKTEKRGYTSVRREEFESTATGTGSNSVFSMKYTELCSIHEKNYEAVNESFTGK